MAKRFGGTWPAWAGAVFPVLASAAERRRMREFVSQDVLGVDARRPDPGGSRVALRPGGHC